MSRMVMVFMILVQAVIPAASWAEIRVSRKEAIQIGRTVAEVEALYAVNNGEYAECIERKVEKPCHSNWVTCIDDAWVVSFTIGARCGVPNDGRLSVTLLIDSVEGEIVSRFPEIEYFNAPDFCRDDYDCMAVGKDEKRCLNFIAAQAGRQESDENSRCACLQNQCVVGEDKN